MAEAFDKGRGFTLAVKGRDGEDQAAFLAGERPGAVFVDVAIEPQAKDGRQRQNQRKKRDGSFFQPSSLPTQRNTAARSARTDSITENARRHKCFLTEPNQDIPDFLSLLMDLFASFRGAKRRGNPYLFRQKPAKSAEFVRLRNGLPRQCAHWLAMTGFCGRYRLYSRQRRSRWNVRRRERETVDLLIRSCWAI